MNKHEANQLLNQVREGIFHPQSAIIRALTITGDIHVKCPSLDIHSDTGTGDRTYPYPLPSALQTT